MSLTTEFREIALEDLHREAALMKVEGWRFMQTHAVNADDGIDLYYSFMKDGLARNLKVRGVTPDKPVPSITDLFLAAFVFENEARELFGVDMRDIALDFAGAMYAPAVGEPMTIVTPEQKAAREKARKAAAAKAAKEASGDSAQQTAAEGAGEAPHVFVMTEERRARLDAKLATMSPEKVAKVEAALKAREAEAAASASAPAKQAAPSGNADGARAKAASSGAGDAKAKEAPVAQVPEEADVDEVLESKISLMDGDAAERVRKALAARRGGTAEAGEAQDASDVPAGDAELESKLALMDDNAAAAVRAAIAAKAKRRSASEGGN